MANTRGATKLMYPLLLAKLPTIIFAANAANTCAGAKKNLFFFLPPWYEYLPMQPDQLGKCAPVLHFPSDLGSLWAIGLAVIDILLRLGGFVAVISIIWAGLDYMLTMGNAEKGVSARKRIVNSIVGLAIVLIAITLVKFIGKSVS